MKEMGEDCRTKSLFQVLRDVGHTYLVISTFFLGWNLISLDLLRDLLAFCSHIVGENSNVLWVGSTRRVGESAETDEGSNQSSPRATLMFNNKIWQEKCGLRVENNGRVVCQYMSETYQWISLTMLSKKTRIEVRFGIM
jgi:hypothetical protein